MKILLDCGHCLQGADTGAQDNGYREENCTREIGYKVKAKLESLGHTVVVVSCDSASSVGEALAYRVNKANSNGGDLFISIHLNAGGGHGAEVYTYGGKPVPQANEILEAICSLGYKNRGIKDGSNLYVIKNTNMRAMLVECCFIDTDDMDKYNAENIANAIVKGITGQTASKPKQAVQYCGYLLKKNSNYDINVKRVQEALTSKGYNCYGADGCFGNNTYGAVLRFQRANGLEQDGIVGQLTWSKLFN